MDLLPSRLVGNDLRSILALPWEMFRIYMLKRYRIDFVDFIINRIKKLCERIHQVREFTDSNVWCWIVLIHSSCIHNGETDYNSAISMIFPGN